MRNDARMAPSSSVKGAFVMSRGSERPRVRETVERPPQLVL
jgi:hypothetical protein